MKSVKADFNRRGPDGMLKVSLRRFDAAPTVGEQFIAIDGDDKFVGRVKAVDPTARTVLMDMNWGQGLLEYVRSTNSRSIRWTPTRGNIAISRAKGQRSPGEKVENLGRGELLDI